jgi:hypothetical protein
MNFLGRKLNGNFQGEIVSDLSSLVCRRTGGSRIKHRVKENWLKMYDKSALVLRVETVINNPEDFRVRKRVTRKGKKRTEWVNLRKGVAWLFRYREVSLKANSRYLDALAVVDDPTDAKRDLDRITTRKKDAAGRGLAVSWIAARALQGLLFGVKFTDPVTFAAVLLLLVTVALLAGYFPARRASRLKPLDALRSE